MRTPLTACLLAGVAALSAGSGEVRAGVPLTDGSDGMTCHYYAANSMLAWRQPGGDWGDATGGRSDASPYSKQVVSPAKALQGVEFDITSLANDWVAGKATPGALYLRGLEGGRSGIVNFLSREHENGTAHPELLLDWDDSTRSRLRPSADTYFACPTHKSLGSRKIFQVGGSYGAALVFPFEARAGQRVKRAVLRLASDKQYSGGATVGVFSLALPVDSNAEVRTGIAAGFARDAGIESHPSVVFAERFEGWRWQSDWQDVDPNGNAETVSSDSGNKFAVLDGKALRVKVKARSRLGLSMHQRFSKLKGGEPEEIYFRYYLRFGADWDPVATGGKLPGLAGTYERAGWGGRKPDGTNGWSARGAFFQLLKNAPEFGPFRSIGSYVYHMDGASEYGDPVGWNLGPTGLLEKNRWYSIEQYVKLNRPGTADGVLRAWIDGRLAYERTNLRYRSVPDLRIESVWMNVYHGGIAKAPADLTLYIDNVVIAREYIGPSGTR